MPTRVVGTDVFHAAILLWAAGLAHIVAGNVDFALAGTILLGSVPGVWLGSHWSVRVEPAVLRTTLAVVLIGAGLALLIKAGLDIPVAVIVPSRSPSSGCCLDDRPRPARRTRCARSRRRRRRWATRLSPSRRLCGPMMVVMTPEATPPQIDAVVAKLEAAGVHAKVMPGELTTAIGAIGDPEGVRELGLEGLAGRGPGDPDLAPLQARLVASSRTTSPPSFEVDGRTVGGGETFCLIAGPVHRRVAGADPRRGARGGERGRLDAARRRLQAAHLALLVPGPRLRGAARSSPRCARRPACRW